MLSDVVESRLHQTETHVVGGVDGGDFTGFKRLNFKQRDGFLGLGALGRSLKNPLPNAKAAIKNIPR